MKWWSNQQMEIERLILKDDKECLKVSLNKTTNIGILSECVYFSMLWLTDGESQTIHCSSKTAAFIPSTTSMDLWSLPGLVWILATDRLLFHPRCKGSYKLYSEIDHYTKGESRLNVTRYSYRQGRRLCGLQRIVQINGHKISNNSSKLLLGSVKKFLKRMCITNFCGFMEGNTNFNSGESFVETTTSMQHSFVLLTSFCVMVIISVVGNAHMLRQIWRYD